MMRFAPRSIAVMLATCCGCAATGNHAYPRSFSSAPTAPAAARLDASAKPRAPEGVTGVWEGVSSADCLFETVDGPGRCHATQKIKLTMVQDGGAVSGFYQCAYGNQVCRNMDENGVIRNGLMKGRLLTMRVMLEDGSMCFFNGMPMSGVIEGRYSCLQGGGIVERGAFKTTRSY
jgi:hypothetical protein